MQANRTAVYHITDGTLDEVMDIATSPGGISDIYQSLPGFVSFRVVDLGAATFASVTQWETRADAETAVTAAASWVKQALAERMELVSHAVGTIVYQV